MVRLGRHAKAAAPIQRRVQLVGEQFPSDGIPYVVHRNRRSRSVRLRFDDDGALHVTIPQRFRMRDLDVVVATKATWIARTLSRLQHSVAASTIDLEAGDSVLFHGVELPTRVERVHAPARSSCVLSTATGPLVVRCHTHEEPFPLLEAWFRGRARDVFAARVAHYAALFNLEYGRISIRDQRTRWGSCSASGSLSFNWRLILAEPWILDAIVVHELCHLDELNHSDRFWALLDERYPRHRAARRWLRSEGWRLRIRGAAAAVTDAASPQPPEAESSGRAALSLF